MQRTMQYTVGGDIYDIPADRDEEFRARAGDRAEVAKSYRVGKDTYTIPQSLDEAFRASVAKSGGDAEELVSMTMSDGSRRDFTRVEMSKYLRSPEYRGSADYVKPEQGSAAWAGVKGALSGAVEGAYAGGKSAIGKAVAALPELAAGATEAVGNAINLGGNAESPVGKWFRDSGRGVKTWLDENVKSNVADSLGYEDWSTKMSEIAGDAAGMAVKFAPAAFGGAPFMESVFAIDGINAYADAYERAKLPYYIDENGNKIAKRAANDYEANLAGAASGLISYYGGKLLMKGNAAISGIEGVMSRALAGIGWDAATMGVQSAANKGVQNVIDGRPITQGMAEAGLEGAATGAQFRIMNEGSHIRDVARETKKMREMRRENLLTVAENANGGEFLDSLFSMGGERLNEAITARRRGQDVSRKMGKAIDLPDNMSRDERNEVVDSIIRARDARAERARTRMDDVQAQALAEEIQGLIGGDNAEFEKVWLNAVGRIEDAVELDDPKRRFEIAQRAVEDVVLRAEKDAAERKVAEQNAQMRRDAKEMTEERPTEQPTTRNEGRGENADMLQMTADQYAKDDADGAKAYGEWLKKQGKKDTAANRMDWFVNDYAKKSENRLSERAEDYAIPEPTAKDEAEFARKETIQNEMDAEKLHQYELDVRAREQEKRNEEKAKREVEAKKYEESERRRIEEEKKSEETLQPQEVKVGVSEKPSDSTPISDVPGKAQWPEYKEWLKKSGRDDTAKSWNRFVMENELDPNLRVDTKDQQAYSDFRQRVEGDVPPEKPRRFPKDQEKAASDEEHRGAVMRMNRDVNFRKLKDAGFSDEDAGYYLTYGKEAFYKKRVAEWEDRKAKAQKQGKGFTEPKPVEPKPVATEPTEVPQANEAPAAAPDLAAARKLLGMDAASKEELERKLAGWKEHPNARGIPERIAAAEALLPTMGGNVGKTADADAAAPMPKKTRAVKERVEPAAEKPAETEPVGEYKLAPEEIAAESADAAFEKWAVDRDGNPLEFGSEAERARSRKLFDSLVKKGSVVIKGEAPAAEKIADEPKTDAQTEGRAAEIDEQKVKMDAADKAAAEAAHAERGEDLAQAFADWKEDAVKAQKQGKVTPKAPAEVEDVRAKAEADAVVQRLNAEWQKAKTPAERNVIKAQLVDRLKELGIGAREKTAEEQSSKTDGETAKVEQPIPPTAAKLADTTPADRLESLRSDDAVKAWAKKNMREVVDGKVSPGAVNDYLKAQVGKAVNATKRLFSDAKVEVVDRDWNAEIDGETNTFRAKDGRIVGTFDPATKEVKLFRGADEKTVYHELGGHGVMDWAERNSKPLYDKLIEAARTAPKEYWDDVRSRYAGADEATIAKEIIARIAEGKGAEFIKLKDAPKTWYAKAYTAVRDALIGFVEMCHGNRIDLDKLNDMTPDEAVNYLFKQIAKGKTLGKLGAADAEGAMGVGEKWANKFWNRHASLEKIDKKSADEKALQPGREAEFQVRKFNVKRDEFKELLRKGDISVNEVDEYMKAVAAEERNAADGFESSGMSDAQIKATREFFAKHPKIKEIERAADYLWKMQEEGMRERIRSGLVSESEYAEWNAREKHHVPFRSAIDENGEWVNQYGRGVSGPEFIQHEGRYSESGSPSTWMFEEYANAHLRAIENDARKVLADAVRNNPALGSIETNPALKESRINGDGGDRNVVSFKTIGKDGKSVTHHIVLKGERGAAAASSYTNRNLANKSPLLRKTQAFMRFWSSTATEWSPTFALRNTFADNADAAMVVLVEKGFKEGGKWLKSYAKNRVAVSKEVWKFARTGKVEDGTLLAQYMKEGGLIGGFQREGYGDLQRQFSADAIAKEFKNGGNRAKAVADCVFGMVKAVNSYAELMTRVAAFKTNTEQGMSGKDAALWSRRISVDFNQQGDITPITNTLFMFSNSTIGATMRQLQAVHTAWKTPQGKRALLGLAAFGMAEAVLEHVMNADEDEERAKRGEATGKDVNEHTRKTSLYVRVGGNVFRAPTHEDPLMKIVYTANATMRYLIGDMNAKDYAKEVGVGALEEIPRFLGQGSKTFEAGWNTWVPTALQPIVQGVENKDYAGRPIYRPKYNEALPSSSNGRKSTQTEYKWMAETLNELTGGNKGRKGSLDFAPETFKLVGESIGKNLGKDLGNAADVGWNILTGNFGDLDSRRTPIVRDVMRKTEGNDNRYFSAMRRFDADKLDLATRDKARNWGEGERRAYYDEHPWLRKNGATSTRVERFVNGYTENGVHAYGINDLRRMEGGERRVKTAEGWKWRTYDWPKEKLEEFRAKRLEKQARVLAIMGE